MRRPIWILLAAAGCGVAAPSGEERLPPPIQGPLIPASSFGEYRSGHYHGGLDFSTGGREGVPVLASRPGWVYRVRASGLGYGRSVYFRMDDARTVVFGHLSRFEPRLAAFVDAEQDRRGRYEVDLFPKPESLAYAAGDTLAYSGQSGVGPPHLHAEVRTGEGASVSVNPWLAGWAPPDSIAPRLSRLRVEPAAPGVLVNGGLEPVVLPLAGPTSSPSLRITGRVRLWIETWDPVSTGSRMAPYRVSLKMDDQVLEQVVFDAIDWNWAREVNWTYNAPLARSRDESWIALESPPGGRLRLAIAEKDWEDALASGPHALTLEVADASGNTSRSLVSLIKEERAAQVPVAAVKRTSMASRGGYLEIRIAGRTADLRVRDASGKTDTPNQTLLPARGGVVFQIGRPDHAGTWSFFAGDSLLGRAFWLPGPETGFSWTRGTDSVRVEAGPVTLRLPTQASYGPLWVLLRSGPAPRTPAGGELEPVSDTVALEPWAMPLRADAWVAFSVSGNHRGLALMSRDKDGWDFVDADTTGGSVRGEVGSLETLAIFRDQRPPKIRILPVAGGRNPRLRAALQDGGVGLLVGSLGFVLDGRDVLSEWDPDAGVLTGHLRAPIPPGLHELAVEAEDRVGNRSRARLAFTVR